ncbi:MAG: hypothetical protein Q9208_003452 [Pyrenodesmia sp. 3 TL-2023]
MCHLLSSVNQRWAYGAPREVNLLDEVVVVTGGMTGLGRCIAEIYAMKGVGVAVMDVNGKEEGESEGVRWYKCDVGSPSMVQKTWNKINDDASAIVFHTSLAAELRDHPKIKTLLVTPGQLDTAMFSHIKLDWFRNFFGPVLEVRELAMKIVNTINEGEGGTIALPAYARWIAWQQILPKGMQNWLKRWSGVDTAAIMVPKQQATTKNETRDSESESESE